MAGCRVQPAMIVATHLGKRSIGGRQTLASMHCPESFRHLGLMDRR